MYEKFSSVADTMQFIGGGAIKLWGSGGEAPKENFW